MIKVVIFILMIVVGLLFNACQLTTASGKSIKKLGLLHKSFKEQHWLTIQGRVSRGVYQWGSLISSILLMLDKSFVPNYNIIWDNIEV